MAVVEGEQGQATARRPARFSQAKLSRPHLGDSIVTRDRALQRLLAGDACVRVVAAGAGSGKTWLLAEHAAAAATAVAWSSVDEGDQDPARFWQAVVAAVRTAVPAFGDEVVELIVLDGAVTADALEAFLDHAARLPDRVDVVLDDLHRAGREVLPGLRWVLERCPDTLRFTISTRVEPAVGLERLLTSGRAVVLRDGDLRFDRGEAGAVLRRLGVALAPAELDLVMGLTGGWAAGVQLTGLVLRDSDHQRDFLERLRTSTTALMSYIWSEVVDAQSPEMRRFLLDTCVADDLTPELAAALCPASPVSLQHVEAASLPITRREALPATFQYQPLFAEALRRRVRETDPAKLAELHAAAARWYATRGEVAATFVHSWRAGQRLEAMRLLHQGIMEAYYAGDVPVVTAAEFGLLDDDLRDAPGPAVGVALALVLNGRLLEAERLLQRVDVVTSDALSLEERLELLCLEEIVAMSRGDMSLAREKGVAAATLAAQAGIVGEWRDLAASMLARVHCWNGEIDAADQVARAVPVEGLSVVRRVEHRGSLAQVDLFAGRLGSCITNARVGLAELQQLSSAGTGQEPLWSMLGCALLERNELAEAEPLLRAVHEQQGPVSRRLVRVLADVSLARLLRARGEVEAAIVVLEGTRLLVGDPARHNPPAVLVAARMGRLLADLGDVHAALKTADSLPPGAEASIVRARCALVTGHHDEARRALGALDGPVLVWQAIEVGALHVALAAAAGLPTHEAADAVLERAAPQGFLFALAESGAAALEALRERARQHARTPFLEQVQRLVPHAALTKPALEYRPDLLTERERLVLRYLATSLSHAEIAQTLYVSVNTLKTHTRNITRKLRASSRRDAVARARAMHYL